MDQPFMMQPLQFTQMPIEKPLRGPPCINAVSIYDSCCAAQRLIFNPNRSVSRRPPCASLRSATLPSAFIPSSVCAIATKRSTHQPIEHNNKQSHRQRLSATRYSQNQESLFFPLISLCFSHPVV